MKQLGSFVARNFQTWDWYISNDVWNRTDHKDDERDRYEIEDRLKQNMQSEYKRDKIFVKGPSQTGTWIHDESDWLLIRVWEVFKQFSSGAAAL